MTKSYKKDIQLLMSILQRQNDIKNAIDHFGCNQNNLEQNKMAFDLCAFYMAQIGEASKTYLKAYIFNMITPNVKEETGQSANVRIAHKIYI